MRWACGGPLWAWCCCARGTNCARRWKGRVRWRREELREQDTGRDDEASGRNDVPAVHRAATGPRTRAGSVRAHAGMRGLPDADAGAGARIAAADPGDAGGGRATAVAIGAISGTCAEIHAMDLGLGIWSGGNGSLCALYRVCHTLAGPIGKGGIRRVEPAGLAGISGRLLERMAVDDHTSRGAGDADAGGDWLCVLPAADPPRFGAGDGVRGILHGVRAGAGGGGIGDSQGPERQCEFGGNDQGRYFPDWRPRESRWDGGRRCVFVRARRHGERARRGRRDRVCAYDAGGRESGWEYSRGYEHSDDSGDGGEERFDVRRAGEFGVRRENRREPDDFRGVLESGRESGARSPGFWEARNHLRQDRGRNPGERGGVDDYFQRGDWRANLL